MVNFIIMLSRIKSPFLRVHRFNRQFFVDVGKGNWFWVCFPLRHNLGYLRREVSRISPHEGVEMSSVPLSSLL